MCPEGDNTTKKISCKICEGEELRHFTNPNGMQSLGLFDGTIDLMHLFKPGFGTASGLTPPLPPEEIACVDSRKICRIELRSVASSPSLRP